MASQESGFTTYATFIKAQVDAEEARKTSIEARGITIITTSGALVTLLFGLSALFTGAEGYVPPGEVDDLLYGALALFVLAGLAGLVTNVPLLYENVKPTELQRVVRDLWADPSDRASKRISATYVKFVYRAQKLNQIKAYVLLFGLLFQIVAVVLVALAVRSILSAT